VRYLIATDILVIHAKIIDKTGGLHGVRDVGLLASLLERPKTSFGGQEMYADIFTKAAVYFESLARYHIFIDGNKRTAVMASARFLFLNGYELMATNKQVEKFVIDVVVEKHDLQTIAAWLESRSKRTE
jgi:death-on-curing protein